MGLFSIKKKAPFEPVVDVAQAAYSADSHIDASEFETVGTDAGSMESIVRPSISFWKDALGRIRRSKVAMVCTIILVLLIIGAVILPIISQFAINDQNFTFTHKPPMSIDTVNGQVHIFGTDTLGRDIFVRVWYGARISLIVAAAVALIDCVMGIVYGGISGYFGGWVDTILMRVVDVVICIPAMPLYIIIGSVMDYYKIDPRIRIYALCAILGIVGWPSIARMVRGQILSLREQEFMVATEATGVRVSRRIFRHLIPNVIPQLIDIATMGLGDVILMEATLSFLGIGVPAPAPEWGALLSAGRSHIRDASYMCIIPGLAIMLLVLSFNVIGDGLRDALDPKLKN